MKKARHSCMMHNSTQPRYTNKTKENLGPNALGANKEINRKTLHTNHAILQWAAAQLNQGWSSWWEFILWTKPLESKLLPRSANFLYTTRTDSNRSILAAECIDGRGYDNPASVLIKWFETCCRHLCFITNIVDCANAPMFISMMSYLLVLSGRSITFILISFLTNALSTRTTPFPACVIQVSEVILAQGERLQISRAPWEGRPDQQQYPCSSDEKHGSPLCKSVVFIVIVAPMMREKHQIQMHWCCLIYFGNAFDVCIIVFCVTTRECSCWEPWNVTHTECVVINCSRAEMWRVCDPSIWW